VVHVSHLNCVCDISDGANDDVINKIHDVKEYV
jgi:hypothetical protein